MSVRALLEPGPGTNWRQVADAAPGLAEPTTIAEWWKNRRGESIRLVLNRYEGRDVVDLRTWYTGEDGKLKPGKGFAVEVRHLPRLAAAFARAVAKALPALGGQAPQQPLRIEVTKTGPAQGQMPSPPFEPWTPPEAPAAAASQPGPPLEPWTPPAPKTPEREVGGGEASLRGLVAGANFEFEPAIVGGYQAAKTALGYGEPGKSAGQAYDEAGQAELEENARALAQHPYLFRAGEFGGAAATRAATTLGRVGMSSLAGTIGGGLTGTGQAVSEGQGAAAVAKSAALGAGVGGVLSGGLGSGIEVGSRIAGRVGSIVRGARNTDAEAARVMAEAAHGPQQARQIRQRMGDRQAGAAGREADTETRLVNYLGVPGHARLRSAANINPEAREMAGEFVQGRYHQQAARVANYLQSKFGGFDTEAGREVLTNAVRKTNAPNYRAAEVAAERRFPGRIWSPKLEQFAGVSRHDRRLCLEPMGAAVRSASDHGPPRSTKRHVGLHKKSGCKAAA